MMKTRTQKLDQKPAEPKTVKTVEKRNRFEMVVVNVLCLFVFLAFGYIALMAFFQTSVIDSTKYASEVILYTADIVPLNLLLTVLFVVFLFAMRRFYDFFARVNLRVITPPCKTARISTTTPFTTATPISTSIPSSLVLSRSAN